MKLKEDNDTARCSPPRAWAPGGARRFRDRRPHRLTGLDGERAKQLIMAPAPRGLP
jgi:hypothetical protein